jgi:hypothetical protein
MEPTINFVSGNESPGMHEVRRLGYWLSADVMLSVALFGLVMPLGCFGLCTAMLAYAACLILATAFVAMIACIDYQAPADGRIWCLVFLPLSCLVARRFRLVRQNAGRDTRNR